jgi:hypothetical protein
MSKFLLPWYQALGSPAGLKLRSKDVHRLRRFLWQARKRSKDRDLWSLSLVLSPHDRDELWIVRQPELDLTNESNDETPPKTHP